MLYLLVVRLDEQHEKPDTDLVYEVMDDQDEMYILDIGIVLYNEQSVLVEVRDEQLVVLLVLDNRVIGGHLTNGEYGSEMLPLPD